MRKTGEKNLSKKVRNHNVMYTVTVMGNKIALRPSPPPPSQLSLAQLSRPGVPVLVSVLTHQPSSATAGCGRTPPISNPKRCTNAPACHEFLRGP
jgi:hypothetical protein